MTGLLAENEYGVYCVPRSARNRPAARAILRSSVWEPETLALLRGVDPEGDIVHAGAFFGDFIPALARSRKGGALVWAFEPNGENYRCARQTVALNDVSNVQLYRAALGSRAGEALLATHDRHGSALGGASALVGQRGDGGRFERVRVVTIDETVGSDREVAVIQLDVEGHEGPALAGAWWTIERCRPLLVLERRPGAALPAFGELRELGYEPRESVHGNVVLSG